MRFLLLMLLVAGAAMAAPARSPNIVIFYADDMGIGDVGAYGCRDIQTPHIDALARNGVRFTNYYSAAPVCSPSRAAMLTGRYPQRCGVPGNVGSQPGARDGLPPTEITIAERAKERGYATALFGKWHLGYESPRHPNEQGFDQFFGFRAGCIDYYSHMFYWQDPPHHDLFRDEEEVHLEGRYLTELIDEQARRFIGQQKDHPFLLYVAFNAPHYPMQAPARFIKPYSSLPPERRIYAAMVSAMDEAIGHIVGELDARGLRDDTFILFASDNGATTEMRANGGGGSNQPYRGFKFSLFDGGVHLPGIVSWRGHVAAGAVRDQLVGAIDVLPTVCEVIGAPIPGDRTIDGRSWLPIFRDASAAGHESLFWQQGRQGAVREGAWKLLMNGALHDAAGGGTPLRARDRSFLCNVIDDPGETQNLATREPQIAARLEAAFTRWSEHVRESGPTTSPSR